MSDDIFGKKSTTVEHTAEFTDKTRVNLPNIGTAAVPIAWTTGLPTALAPVPRGITTNIEGSQIAGLMMDEDELCPDYDLRGDGSLWTAGAGWTWDAVNRRFNAAAGTNTAVRFTENILTLGFNYLIVAQVVRAAGQVVLEAGTGGPSVAIVNSGIWGCVLTAATTQQVGILATGFTGSFNLLRPLRIGPGMAAFADYYRRYGTIAACVMGNANAGAQVSALY